VPGCPCVSWCWGYSPNSIVGCELVALCHDVCVSNVWIASKKGKKQHKCTSHRTLYILSVMILGKSSLFSWMLLLFFFVPSLWVILIRHRHSQQWNRNKKITVRKAHSVVGGFLWRPNCKIFKRKHKPRQETKPFKCLLYFLFVVVYPIYWSDILCSLLSFFNGFSFETGTTQYWLTFESFSLFFLDLVFCCRL